jgi:hypothetical protein
MSSSLLRYGYCPLMLVGVNGAAIWLIASGAPKGLLPLCMSSDHFGQKSVLSKRRFSVSA